MLVNITVTVHLTLSENIAEFSEILDLTLCHWNQEKQQKVMASFGPYHSTCSRWCHCNTQWSSVSFAICNKWSQEQLIPVTNSLFAEPDFVKVMSYRPARLGIDSLAPLKVYTFGLWCQRNWYKIPPPYPFLSSKWLAYSTYESDSWRNPNCCFM